MEKTKMENLGLPYSVIAKESHTPLVSVHFEGIIDLDHRLYIKN